MSCADARGTLPEPQYAFAHISIPVGVDACQDVGPFADPRLLYLTNDGSRVAFGATDFKYQGDVWYGDLMTGSVKIVYQAPQTTSSRTAISSVQLGGGHLVWLEQHHSGPDIESSPVREWTINEMNVSSGTIKVVAHGLTPAFGGHALVNDMRFDGQRIAMAETLAHGWQIEITDLSGVPRSTVAASNAPFDLALVSDGLLYSTGIANSIGAVGNTRLWHWTPNGGSKQIGAAVFQINADASLAAWVADPTGSRETTGNPQEPRLYASTPPFTEPQALSPAVSPKGTQGIDGMSCGSGAVAWWEIEDWNTISQDVLTVWQPGWSSPVQVDTDGSESYRVSVQGGWLVWEEEFGRENSSERIRGVPLSLLAGQRQGS